MTTIIPRVYTYYISSALFAIFGFKMLYDGIRMSKDEGAEELEEVQAALRRQEEDVRFIWWFRVSPFKMEWIQLSGLR